MQSITIIDNKYATLIYHPDSQIVHHHFTELLDSAHTRLILDSGIDLLKQHKATKWLSDNRDLKPHSEEDGKWVNEDWLPRAIAAGWKYWALVVPETTIARLNMVEFVQLFLRTGTSDYGFYRCYCRRGMAENTSCHKITARHSSLRLSTSTC